MISVGIVYWSITRFKELDCRIRKLLRFGNCISKSSSIARLTLPRHLRGRGLLSEQLGTMIVDKRIHYSIVRATGKTFRRVGWFRPPSTLPLVVGGHVQWDWRINVSRHHPDQAISDGRRLLIEVIVCAVALASLGIHQRLLSTTVQA